LLGIARENVLFDFFSEAELTSWTEDLYRKRGKISCIYSAVFELVCAGSRELTVNFSGILQASY
jgi:hypothetical protein